MRIHKNSKVRFSMLGSVAIIAIAGASLLSGNDATADASASIAGTQAIYGAIAPDQVESLSTGDRIKSVVQSGSMMAIWQTLEHGEKVECIDCIPYVAPLVYDANPRTREIAAWWLRRRIFGVFGPGEVYTQILDKLKNDPDPVTRGYAASAIGEFLTSTGADALATSIATDADPTVRAASATALGRMNSDGNGAITKALADTDARVRAAGLKSATSIAGFADRASLARLTADPDALVRRAAAESIGATRATEGVDGLIALAKDPDANVRNSAVHALGALRDARAKDVLTDLAANDTNGLVRDQAKIALRRL